jgi:hypothetical protein
MTKYNKRIKMNRNKSLGVNRSRGGDRNYDNRDLRGQDFNQRDQRRDLMRMDDFDRMFEDFAMPRFGGFGGMDNFFRGFGDMRSGFDDMEREL